MSNKEINSRYRLNQDLDSSRFFPKVEIPYEKSTEDIWNLMEDKLAEKPEPRIVRFYPKRIGFGIAAAILLLLGIASILRFYTRTIECPRGQHVQHVMPDGSTVEMNAESFLAYHPYWWHVSRKIDFEGEAFFEVTEGKSFEVLSENGKTIVLGTSFNIFSRGKSYKVSCLSGNIKVISNTHKDVILSPNYKAEIVQNGEIKVQKLKEPALEITWTRNMFLFTASPLPDVFKEIERQYNIRIITATSANHIYTGNFSKDNSIETVLDLVCKPFGLSFVKTSDNEYQITPK